MKLLAAIDLSDASARVIEQTRILCTHTGASVCLLHVAPPDPDFVGYEPGPQHVRDNLAHEFREEHRRLQEMARDIRTWNIDCSAHLVQGPAAAAILAEADRLAADFIVIGSHGHGAVHHLLAGSVGRAVLQSSRRPVIVVPVGRSATAPANTSST